MAGEGWRQRQGEKRLDFVDRVRQAQLAENAAKAAALAAAAKPKRKRAPAKPKAAAAKAVADRIDGYDRDDIGLSPDF